MEDKIYTICKLLEAWFKNQSVYKAKVFDPENEKSENVRVQLMYDVRGKSNFGARILVDVSDGYTGVRTCINPIVGLGIFGCLDAEFTNFILSLSKRYKYYYINTFIDDNEVAILEEDCVNLESCAGSVS